MEHNFKTRYNNQKLSFNRPFKINLGPKEQWHALITQSNGPLSNKQVRTKEVCHAAICAYQKHSVSLYLPLLTLFEKNLPLYLEEVIIDDVIESNMEIEESRGAKN